MSRPESALVVAARRYLAARVEWLDFYDTDPDADSADVDRRFFDAERALAGVLGWRRGLSIDGVLIVLTNPGGDQDHPEFVVIDSADVLAVAG